MRIRDSMRASMQTIVSNSIGDRLECNRRLNRAAPWQQRFRRNSIVADDHVIVDRLLRLWPRGFVVKIKFTGCKRPPIFVVIQKCPPATRCHPKKMPCSSGSWWVAADQNTLFWTPLSGESGCTRSPCSNDKAFFGREKNREMVTGEREMRSFARRHGRKAVLPGDTPRRSASPIPHECEIELPWSPPPT